MSPQDAPMGDGSGPSEPPVIERRAPRWMKIVLLASLGLNLIIVGLVLGIALRVGGGERPDRGMREGAMPLTRALEPEDRRAVGRAIREAMRQSGSRAASQAEMAALVALLRADAFDAEAFAAELEGQVSRMNGRIRVGQEALVAHLAQMSPEARRAYADRIEAGQEKRGGKP